MQVDVRLERSARQGESELWVVSRGGREVGFVTKIRRTRGENHPWKAFRGIGMTAAFLGAFYSREGGKSAAIRAVLG